MKKDVYYCIVLSDSQLDFLAGSKYGIDRMKERVQENYNRIKEEARQIVADELERIGSDPNLKHLLELNKQA